MSESGFVEGDLGKFPYFNTDVVAARCPIDNTPLIVDYESDGRGMKYDCRACRAAYFSLDPAENMQQAQRHANEIYRLREDASKKVVDLDKILDAAEKRGIEPVLESEPKTLK